MVIVVLVTLGLCLGSFVNALVWRLHEQQVLAEKRAKKGRKAAAKADKELSIMHGRSMCPHCKHQLQAVDLVPLYSWLSLGGKCRYCKTSIAWQYPVVELATAALFVLNYLCWPRELNGAEVVVFGIWSLLLTGFMALAVYDLKWYLLPNRIVYPLSGFAGVYALLEITQSVRPDTALLNTLLAVAVGGGIFYALFQLSKGAWIGGGDVKLGWLLGLVVGSPEKSFLFIFLAALGGSLVAIPLLATKKLKPTTVIPFGPFLIVAAIVTVLFGADILHWYRHTFIIGG